jgi:hypothetical protein
MVQTIEGRRVTGEVVLHFKDGSIASGGVNVTSTKDGMQRVGTAAAPPTER